jgi:uncharacterized membrane protein
VDEALRLFESDTMDAASVAALRADAEARHRAVGDAIAQAITEIHDTLTPGQRQVVAAYVRTHHALHH